MSRTLACFSHLRWNFVYQRPQHLMTRAAAHESIAYFEEPVFSEIEAPRLDHRIEHCNNSNDITVLVPQLPHGLDRELVAGAQRQLVDEWLKDKTAQDLTLWYYTPMARAFTDHIAASLIVYDCMDELAAFAFPPAGLREHERELLSIADVVFTGGPSLFRSKRGLNPNVIEAPSSIDRDHFTQARSRQTPDPFDQADLIRPRLGFFGVIDERMDLELVDAVAAMRPQWSLVFLGPVVKIDPAKLPRRNNIHWLGQKPYGGLPQYLANWDVAIMPFAINEATRFISPTKTPEYLSGGVPVVSTPVPDVQQVYGRSGFVEIAATPDAFVSKAEAVMRRERAPWLAGVDAHLATLSWDRTFGIMRDAMQSARDSRNSNAAVMARTASEQNIHV